MTSATTVPVPECQASGPDPKMDVNVQEDRVVLTVEAPSAGNTDESESDEFEVWVDEGLLLVAGPVCRSFVLPPQVDVDGVKASVHGGRVSITLPLAAGEAAGVRVEIETPAGRTDRERSFALARESQTNNEWIARS